MFTVRCLSASCGLTGTENLCKQPLKGPSDVSGHRAVWVSPVGSRRCCAFCSLPLIDSCKLYSSVQGLHPPKWELAQDSSLNLCLIFRRQRRYRWQKQQQQLRPESELPRSVLPCGRPSAARNSCCHDLVKDVPVRALRKPARRYGSQTELLPLH